MYSNLLQWREIRKKILIDGISIHSISKGTGISRNTIRKILKTENPTGYGGRGLLKKKKHSSIKTEKPSKTDLDRIKWQEWIYEIERGNLLVQKWERALSGQNIHKRKIVLAVMAKEEGFTIRAISEHLSLSRNTILFRSNAYIKGGMEGLLGRKSKPSLVDDVAFTKALFTLLHEPPSLSGFNRTSWRLDDLRQALLTKGFEAGKGIISKAIRKAGFRWRSAKVVLTSTDPKYREKLEHIQSILSNLDEDERFFSIDEYGPFAIKTKPGRILSGPSENPSVPQWQKSKGWLIATAALELSRNQITHFYSKAKNTAEMIKMAEILLAQYTDCKKLYLSWDAASWHMSKVLLTFVKNNNNKNDGTPLLELVPLPASAQFLNVIESFFSGMSRAIIHNSDYQSVEFAKEAIDRYIRDRNNHYEENPKRAGKKIWGKERTKATFDPSNNCKDPAYR
jgi:transposase